MGPPFFHDKPVESATNAGGTLPRTCVCRRRPAPVRYAMLRVFGSRISYYTGKLEAYLRFRAIDYELLPTEPHRAELLAGCGVVQMPVVQLDDGRWMTDSTPMLRWFDGQQDGPSIYPKRPGDPLHRAPPRGLRRRMALAPRDALSVELPSRPHLRRHPPRG